MCKFNKKSFWNFVDLKDGTQNVLRQCNYIRNVRKTDLGPREKGTARSNFGNEWSLLA